MKDILKQIKSALDCNLYYCALFLSLSVPDICGAMESDDGLATGNKYTTWFDKYVSPRYRDLLTGEDCYRFRCSLLHQGSSQHPKSTYSRVIFIEPIVATKIFHCNILNDALNIDVNIFCNDIIDGVEEWLKLNEGTERYLRNYEMFMRRYPEGLPPYIVGVSVIS